MKLMDKLPTVISCCFCCFLRAGTVVIAVVSFLTGLLLAPNVSHTHGFWDLNGSIVEASTTTETAAQMCLGIVSIMLCVISIFLLIGALCNIPKFLMWYQWGAAVYTAVIFVLFFALAVYCVFVHGNCALASGTLLLMMIGNVAVTAYFIIVVNSLRMSMVYLNADILNI